MVQFHYCLPSFLSLLGFSKLIGGREAYSQSRRVQQIEVLANILKCKVEDLPTIYSGMPWGSKHKEIKIWDGIIEKSEKKQAIWKWKSQFLSLRGRVILINSVLDSMPTYVMSLFSIAGKVVKVLDALRRGLTW